ncbi:DUF2877 domain-containing protein [Gulosibacter macacae]|uniref:DUF2877 domain-containing protein n=1 Tax=Gulosibacter macacae TaxID=2488791 RepID=A0A3P3VUX6_9MICO|nr:DUF2877 domain-containing protein [Gulosibacter macacae]RRJ85778.1 DUF2877 domain-containing protein [Gulosibacter macacae]
MITRALAADTDWRDALRVAPSGAERGRALEVASSFDRALNLRRPAGGLLTVLTRAGRPAPGALITELDALPRIPAGTPVTLDSSPAGPTLTVRRLRITLAGHTEFDCGTVPLDAVSASLADSATAFRAALDAVAAPGSFVATTAATPYEAALQRRLLTAATNWQAAIRGEGALADAAASLIGLGAGLTPSGDDYLAGALAVLHLHPITGANGGSALEASAAVRAATSAADATTEVGRHFLLAACEGRFHHDVAAAATAALTGTTNLPQLVAQVAEIGSTSGTDTLTGIADTLAALAATTARIPAGRR